MSFDGRSADSRQADLSRFRQPAAMLAAGTEYSEGCLAPGYWGDWQWTRDGKRVAYISMQAKAEGLHLTYRMQEGGGEWEDVAYTVPLIWSSCTKGGERPFFRCPGMRGDQACSRRVAKLYSGGRYFLCRHCYRLTYESRSEEPYDRHLRRANKLRQAMGGEPGTESLIPPRRKGQWARTYEAKLTKIIELEELADLKFGGWFTRRFPGARLSDFLAMVRTHKRSGRQPRAVIHCSATFRIRTRIVIVALHRPQCIGHKGLAHWATSA